MTLPAQITVTFDFSSGATFGAGFIIGSNEYGVIGVNAFGSSDVVIPTVDLTPDVRSIAIRSGRNIMKDTYEAATATVSIFDPLGYFNPQNPDSPYFGYLVPLRKLRIAATAPIEGGSVQSFLFSGYVTDYKYYFPQGQETAYVDIVCADGLRLLQMSNVATIADTPAGQDTGTRIEKILDDVQWPDSMRAIFTGQNTCIADPGTIRTTLEAIKNVEFSEGMGAFFMNPDGTAVFYSRQEVLETLGNSAYEFNQTGGIPYKSLRYAYDDKLIINSVSFKRIGGNEVRVINQDSIDRYFPHSLNHDTLVAETDAIVENVAREYVSTRQYTTIRIDEMVVDLQDPAVPTDVMIGMNFFDNLKITNVTPEGSTIVKTLQCQGVAWDITPNKMVATITTLEPIADGFIIGSDTYGIIGVSTLSY